MTVPIEGIVAAATETRSPFLNVSFDAEMFILAPSQDTPVTTVTDVFCKVDPLGLSTYYVCVWLPSATVPAVVPKALVDIFPFVLYTKPVPSVSNVPRSPLEPTATSLFGENVWTCGTPFALNIGYPPVAEVKLPTSLSALVTINDFGFVWLQPRLSPLFVIIPLYVPRTIWAAAPLL